MWYLNLVPITVIVGFLVFVHVLSWWVVMTELSQVSGRIKRILRWSLFVPALPTLIVLACIVVDMVRGIPAWVKLICSEFKKV